MSTQLCTAFAISSSLPQDLEDEIEKLESSSELSASDKARLKDIKTELENILKKKEEYVAEHPEHRRLVFKSRRPAESRDDKKDDTSAPKKRNLFRKNGLPRHPERSIYYDPVMNPFGVPPPGLPYVERGTSCILYSILHYLNVTQLFSQMRRAAKQRNPVRPIVHSSFLRYSQFMLCRR